VQDERNDAGKQQRRERVSKHAEGLEERPGWGELWFSGR
jgi:hypothetical protein